MNGGFSFPFALYRRERYGEHGEHDKTIVTRLYVQIEDAARAFDKVKFISKIELLIGRRAGSRRAGDAGECQSLC